MSQNELKKRLDALVALPQETEWLEFKLNYHSAEEIGERISAISNSACLWNRPFGYLIFGVEDETHKIPGTTFKAKSAKKGNEELEMWLLNRLNPRIDFRIYEFDYGDAIHISLFVIPAAVNKPVEFLHKAYIRVGASTKLIEGYPEKAAKIWRKNNVYHIENEIVKENLSAAEVIDLLSVETYFDLMKIPMPATQSSLIERLMRERLVVQSVMGYSITKLGAILFAKHLHDFKGLERKAVRIIVYKGRNKIDTVREQIADKGYAVGFASLIDWVNGQLPANEEIGHALRKNVRMYPEISIRELCCNALIHQDFAERGFPVVEIYSDRIEISNPGLPLISSERFIDEYISRNEALADIMRRMGFCEEKGSGMDKVIYYNEIYQLPAVNIQVAENRTTVVLYAYKNLNNTDKQERIRACYQHACLKYVSNEKMTNASLRERFGIDSKNYATASRIIRESLLAQVIKEENADNKSKKYSRYLPFWA